MRDNTTVLKRCTGRRVEGHIIIFNTSNALLHVVMQNPPYIKLNVVYTQAGKNYGALKHHVAQLKKDLIAAMKKNGYKIPYEKYMGDYQK